MTGARILCDLNIQELTGAVERLQALTADFKPLLKVLGVGLVDTTQKRFEAGRDPEGNPWKALNPTYAQFKRGPGILRERAMRGGLMGSITFKVEPGNQVAVGSGKIYAAVHQFGAVIKPKGAGSLVFRFGKKVIHAKKVTIPARPYLGFGQADRLVANDAINQYLSELIGGGA